MGSMFKLLIILVLSQLPMSAVYANHATTDLRLTEAETKWLHQHPSVIFTGDPNWLPYEAFDEHDQYIGIVSEHIKIISQLTGLHFKMSPSKTWTESTEKAKHGMVDILSETDDSDLKSHLDFTDPYISNPIVIAMHGRENYVEGIKAIEHKKIALIKDYGYVAKIRRQYSKIKFVTVDDIQSGLLAVSTGEVDAMLCTLALCSYTISELGLNNVRITGKTEFDTKLALGVQKNLPYLRSILNKAIKKISREQQQAILDSWIKNKFAEKIDYTLAMQIAFVGLFVVTIFIFWNRRLSREINLRIAIEKDLKSTEQEMKFSHQRLLSHREHTPLGVIEWNVDFKVTDWNDAAEAIFGFSKKEMMGRSAIGSIIASDTKEEVAKKWQNLLQSKDGERSSNENLTKNGETIFCEWYNTPLVDESGNVIGVASLVDDITKRKLSEQMIWEQANYDALTGLPNRNMFHDRLEHEVLRAERNRQQLALLLIDLDQFKEVNDTLGHDKGDVLLKEASRRIGECVRNSDTVARLGGDEFTVIVSDIHEAGDIEDVARKIIGKLEKEYLLDNEVVHISASIGITVYPDDSREIDSLIKNADQAMYAAKRQGRHCFSYFTQSLQDAAQKKMRLTSDLRIAIQKEEFELYYQPILNLQTDDICKAEALIRWNHPKRGLVAPDDFIHLAEESGLINKIGDWVFKQAAQKAKEWGNKLDQDFQVSVNMSPVQFRAENKLFITEWQEFMRSNGIAGKSIVGEITEGLLLNAEPDILDKLLWLRDAGIQVAIDDFGTGYSSLAYLNKFDIDYLKIDRVFVNNLESNENDVALCSAIIAMSHTLGLQVIAEGVETEKQKNILKNAGCDYAQGYLFSRPVPADEFKAMLD